MEMFATMARNSFDGLNTGTGRAETSTGEPVRGLRAMRVLRCRILNVPKPRTSMFFCCWSASLIASRNESTTRAQSFLEIIGPAVCEICAVTRSTRSAFVIDGPRERRVGTDDQRLETRPLPIVCQALGSLEAARENCAGRANGGAAEFGLVSAGALKRNARGRYEDPDRRCDLAAVGGQTRALRTVSMNSWNNGRPSWGPGAASGWYWTPKTAYSR